MNAWLTSLIRFHRARSTRLALVVAMLVSSAGQPAIAQGAASASPPRTTDATTGTADPVRPLVMLPTVAAEQSDEVTVAYHTGTGKARFLAPARVGRALAHPSALSASASSEDAARGFLAVYGRLFGLRDQSRELIVRRAVDRDGGRASVRLQQTHQGIPILAGEIIVNLDAARNVLSVGGEILPDVAVNISPTIDASTALRTAVTATARAHGVAQASLTASRPELWIYNPVLLVPWSGPTVLTWRVEVTSIDLGAIRQLVLVDAHRGGIALSFNQVDMAKNRLTYTASNSTTLPGTLICSESNPTCTGGDSHAVAAHRYAGHTYDFYSSYHGRDSLDDAGATLTSSVHYDIGYCNAFWNGSQMAYGDGCTLTVDDIVAHEFTHGVTQYESNLFYYYQSGAINESFSDLWGEFVDLTNGDGTDTPGVRWQLGEDASIGAFRNMQNPPAFGDPDKMTSVYYVKGAGDNGGVHTNSGINNKAVALMTDGGTFNGWTITGLGITKVANIYYEVQTNLLTSGSDYADLYTALYQACVNLIGVAGISSSDCQQVRHATLAVEMNQQPIAGFNPDAQVCPIGKRAVNVFVDDFENGFSGWTLGAISGTNFWSTTDPWGPNAHSGTKDLYADDFYTSSNAYAQMTNAVTIPEHAYLHFYHTFDLESGWDGAVIEYSTDGISWADAGSMIDSGQSYTGTATALGSTGFTGASHGYVSTRLDLSSLFGQNVRFRWRMATDAAVDQWGWWLDDVRIYACAPKASADFNGDGTSDVVINRPVVGAGSTWLFHDFTSGVYTNGVWTGATGACIPAPMDYDGDGTANFTQLCGGAWHFYNADGSHNKGIWTGGVPGDVPAPADYNGDGTDDVVVFRHGAWLFYDFATGNWLPASSVWTGKPPHWTGGTSVPAPMDYDGDGTADFTVFSGGPWHFFNDNGSYKKGIWTGGVAGDQAISRRLLP